MKIIFLGSDEAPLASWLRSQGEEVVATMNSIDLCYLKTHSADFIVSHGYRQIIRKDVIAFFNGRAINLHISYLPWNKGADPNLWSWVDETPKGVTIHYLDEGLDTGDIIVQKEVFFFGDDTLRTSYVKLQRELEALFKNNWGFIRSGKCPRRKQVGAGSYHRSADKTALSRLMVKGWDTPVSMLLKFAAEVQVSAEFVVKYYSECLEFDPEEYRV